MKKFILLESKDWIPVKEVCIGEWQLTRVGNVKVMNVCCIESYGGSGICSFTGVLMDGREEVPFRIYFDYFEGRGWCRY